MREVFAAIHKLLLSALFPRSIAIRLFAVILLASVLPTAVVAWLSYATIYNTIKEAKIRDVGLVAAIRHDQLVFSLNRTRSRAEQFLSAQLIQCNITRGHSTAQSDACLQSALTAFVQSEKALGAVLHRAGVSNDLVVGTRTPTHPDEWTLKPGQLAVFPAAAPGIQHPRIYHVPVADHSRRIRLVVSYPASSLQDIFIPSLALGESGETFLADTEGFFITKPRYDSEQGRNIPISAMPMEHCLQKMDMEMLELDYRAIPIIHGFRYIAETGGGCIMAHIEQQEAFQPLHALQQRIALVAGTFALLMSVIGISLGRRIVRPIHDLNRVTREIASGNNEVLAAESGGDEIADLARSFNLLTQQVRDYKMHLERRVRDRTAELEAANASLQENQARLRALFETTAIAIVVIDERGCIEEFNPASEAMFGYARNDILGQNVSVLMPEPYHSEHDGYLGRYLDSGQSRIIGIGREVPAKHKDGSIFQMELSVGEVHLGSRRAFVGFLKDISERKRLEAATKQYEAIVQSSEDAIVGKTLEGIVTSWNRGAQAIFGYSAAEMTGQPLLQLFPADKVNEEKRILRKVARGERVSHYETVRLDKSGNPIDVSVKTSPIFDADGKIVGASSIARDITSRKKAERELLEAYTALHHSQEMLMRQEKLAAMGTLVGGVAHEINNPLMGIIGYISYAHDNIAHGKPRQLLEKALVEVERIARIVRSMLVFGRLSPQENQHADVYATVARIAELTQGDYRDADIRLLLELPPNLPLAAINEDSLQQALLNLLLNARDSLKNMAPPREVVIAAQLIAGDTLELSVSDNGAGVSEGTRHRIFDPFFTTKAPGSGTGLGLAVSRQMVEEAGGTLELAASTSGARFVLRLSTCG